jgi:hypothetical protein
MRNVRSVRRLAILSSAVAVLAAAPPLLAATPPFKATITAATRHPKAGTKWYYTVRAATLSGAPLAARITVQIKDPLGTLHPVLYANTKKKLLNWPIKGRFTDYVIWPKSSAIGITLTLRVVVKTSKGTVTLAYPVTPRA